MDKKALLKAIEEEMEAGNTAIRWLSHDLQREIDRQVPLGIVIQGLHAVIAYLRAF